MAIEASDSRPRGSVSITVKVAENGYVVHEAEMRGDIGKVHVARNSEELMYVLAELCAIGVNSLDVEAW